MDTKYVTRCGGKTEVVRCSREQVRSWTRHGLLIWFNARTGSSMMMTPEVLEFITTITSQPPGSKPMTVGNSRVHDSAINTTLGVPGLFSDKTHLRVPCF